MVFRYFGYRKSSPEKAKKFYLSWLLNIFRQPEIGSFYSLEELLDWKIDFFMEIKWFTEMWVPYSVFQKKTIIPARKANRNKKLSIATSCTKTRDRAGVGCRRIRSYIKYDKLCA